MRFICAYARISGSGSHTPREASPRSICGLAHPRHRISGTHARSPRIRRASWMSLGMIVTRLAWIAQRLVSSKSETRYDSEASWSARMAVPWKRRSDLKSWAISRTRRWNGSLRMSRSVDFWYLRISRSATVPGRYRCGFLTPPVVGADLRAALVASCLRGALPPVDLRAVCLVRAILSRKGSKGRERCLRPEDGVWAQPNRQTGVPLSFFLPRALADFLFIKISASHRPPATGHRPPKHPNTQSPKSQPLRATAAFPGLAAAVLGDAGR